MVKMIYPSPVKQLMIPLIAALLFVVYFVLTPATGWLNDLAFFLAFTLLLAFPAVPFLATRITLDSEGEVTVSWTFFTRHKFNAKQVVSVRIDSLSSIPRLAGLFSYYGLEVSYKKAGSSKETKAKFSNSLYRIRDLKSLVYFLAENGCLSAKEALSKFN